MLPELPSRLDGCQMAISLRLPRWRSTTLKTKADTTDCFDQSAQVTQFLAKFDDLNIDRPQGYGVVRSLNSVDDLLARLTTPAWLAKKRNSRNSALVSVTGLPSMATSRLAESMTIP